MKTKDLENYLKDLLKVDHFKDSGPNGLQVQGRPEVKRLALAVSATKYSISEALRQGADGLLVHHGVLWNSHGARPLSGPYGERIFTLIRGQVNLLAYHLPLDAHARFGNNAVLAKKLGLRGTKKFGTYSGAEIGIQGVFQRALSVQTLEERLEKLLRKRPLIARPESGHRIRSLGIISGGAGGLWTSAAAAGLDAYLTGEVSEHHWNESKEAGVYLISGGHYATERWGVRALGEHLERRWKLQVFFIEEDTPV